MRGDNLPARIKEAKRQLAELKTAQPIAGDSWIMYRFEKLVYIGTGSVRTADLNVEFVPDNPGVFPVIMTLTAGYVPHWSIELLQESEGVYKYYANQSNFDSVSGNLRLIAQSTRKGTINATLTNVTWW